MVRGHRPLRAHPSVVTMTMMLRSCARRLGHGMRAAVSTAPVPAVRMSARALSSSSRPALTTFSEEEDALREAVSRFAHDQVLPHAREMDRSQELNMDILKGLFEQGASHCTDGWLWDGQGF